MVRLFVQRNIERMWFLVPGGLAFAVYASTLAPGVVGFDSAELVTGAYTLGIVHPTGYPLYLILAKLFSMIPVGSIAFRVNLFSAVCAAVAVTLLSIMIFQLTGRRWAALFAGGVFAFLISFWQMAVVAEVYTLHLLFMTLEMVLLLQWHRTGRMRWLDLFVLVYALSLTNHVSGVLFAPAFGWFVLRGIEWKQLVRRLPLYLFLGLVGMSPYLYLPLRQMAQPRLDYVSSYYNIDMGTLSGLWWMISGQAYHFFAFNYDLAGYLREVAQFGQLLVRNVTVVGILFGLMGWWQAVRERSPFRLVLPLLFISYLGFYIGYGVVDKATMFLPAHLVWVIWMTFGVQAMYDWALTHLQAMPEPLPARLFKVGMRMGAAAFVAAFMMLNWTWADMSEAYGPEIFAEQVLVTIDEEAFIMGEWSSAVILEYYQTVEGMRPDVEIFNRSRFQVAQYYVLLNESMTPAQAAETVYAFEEVWISSVAADRPVYSVEYDPRLASSYEYQPVGNVFQLIPRN